MSSCMDKRGWYMESISLPGMILLAALSAGGGNTDMTKREAANPQYASASCALTGQSRAGARKICYYNCGGVTRTVVVPPAKVCPHTIRR